MEVDMRHTKLKAEEAALLAGEVEKPSWASRNEGIHERVSFEDTIWGFELAGGAYYKTPLRVTYVKPGSRAEQACIKMGDTVLRINDIDTSTLTLQEAHEVVIKAGIHLKIAVTSPDDEVDAYYSYRDPTATDDAIPDDVLKALEAERIRRLIAKATRHRDLQWPWVRRKIIIYRESNCFLVPSKYEGKHKDQFPELPHIRYTDDITEFNNTRNKLEAEIKETKEKASEEAKLKAEQSKQHQNSDVEDNEVIDQNVEEEFDKLVDNMSENNDVEIEETEELQEDLNEGVENKDSSEEKVLENNLDDGDSVEVLESEEENLREDNREDVVENLEEVAENSEEVVENLEEVVENSEGAVENEIGNVENSIEELQLDENVQEIEEISNNEVAVESTNEIVSEEINHSNTTEVLEELEFEETNKIEDEKIVDGIINENGQYEEIMDSSNER